MLRNTASPFGIFCRSPVASGFTLNSAVSLSLRNAGAEGQHSGDLSLVERWVLSHILSLAPGSHSSRQSATNDALMDVKVAPFWNKFSYFLCH